MRRRIQARVGLTCTADSATPAEVEQPSETQDYPLGQREQDDAELASQIDGRVAAKLHHYSDEDERELTQPEVGIDGHRVLRHEVLLR